METLHKLTFDSKDKIATPKLRSRIRENFDYETLSKIHKLITDPKYPDNNDKVDVIKSMMTPRGFLELGSGTNRFAMLKENYVYKFALDHYGYDDNNTEFDMSMKLQPYVSKTYECNGLICVAEYVNIISKNDFEDNKPVMRNILESLAEDYLFADLGIIEKNFRNWGYNDSHELVILDYGYIFERDDVLMRCTKCGGRIGYDRNYDQMMCEHCKKKFAVHDIRAMMNASDEERTELFKKKDKVKLTIDPVNDKVSETDFDSFIKIN